MSAGIDNERIRGFVSGKEIDAITKFIGEQSGLKSTIPVLSAGSNRVRQKRRIRRSWRRDERFMEAAQMVVTTKGVAPPTFNAAWAWAMPGQAV